MNLACALHKLLPLPIPRCIRCTHRTGRTVSDESIACHDIGSRAPCHVACWAGQHFTAMLRSHGICISPHKLLPLWIHLCTLSVRRRACALNPIRPLHVIVRDLVRPVLLHAQLASRPTYSLDSVCEHDSSSRTWFAPTCVTSTIYDRCH